MDPFAGIGGFAFHAMANGLSWVGVELEEKFVALGRQNIEHWNDRFGVMPKWGAAQIVCADSRDLIRALQDAIEWCECEE